MPCLSKNVKFKYKIVSYYLFRDWFRINPLEMVLLGCETLQTCSKSTRDVSYITCIVQCVIIMSHNYLLQPLLSMKPLNIACIIYYLFLFDVFVIILFLNCFPHLTAWDNDLEYGRHFWLHVTQTKVLDSACFCPKSHH